MPKTHGFAVTENAEKLEGPRSQKNAKNSQVCHHEKMPKTSKSVVTENAENSQVRGQRKIPKTASSARGYGSMPINFHVCCHKKCICQQVRDNAKNSQVNGHRKMPKTRRSAVTEKWQKLAGPPSLKNAKNLLFWGHGKIPKTRRSAVMENAKNS